MSDAKMMESDEREIIRPTQNLAIRDSAPPLSSRTLEDSHVPSWTSSVQEVSSHSPSHIWAGAISRIQAQNSLNTSMLESHRRQIQEIDGGMRDLSQQLGNVFSALREIRAELHARPSAPPISRHDPGDLDVLAGQVEAVTSKANEVDGLKMQIELLKNKFKRLEEQGVTGGSARPRTSSSHRAPSIHELPPQSHLDRPPHHQPLPPMRTASMASPAESRTAGLPTMEAQSAMPTLESHVAPRYPLSAEPQQYSIDSSRTMQSSSGSSFRPSEPSLPPPSSLPGWRSSESLPHPGGNSAAPHSASHSRPQTMEPEPQGPGWASINANQTAKRPFEEPRRSPYESPGSGSPKRPKLAPIMPRSSYGDESYVTGTMTPSGTGDQAFRPGSRASDLSQSHARNISTPDSASTSSYRFITSTAQADSQESWRPESERRGHLHHHHGPHGPHQHGRNRGKRGGRGGRGGRGARGGGVQLPGSQQFGTPEWEGSDWTGSQIGPNGFYQPLHPYAPRGRGGLIRRGGGGAGGAGGPREHEHDHDHEDIPQTPVEGPEDPSADDYMDNGLHPTSGGKKTRTKPIRNAEGVLIRKDGRPDMRSVSSANNLRKVHAKKEAERAEMEGRTPTSARSLAPADAYSDDEEDSHSIATGTPGEQDEMDNEEHFHDNSSHTMGNERNTDERLLSQVNQESIPEAEMKTEGQTQQQDDQRGQLNGSSQMTDTVMREMSDAQAGEHRYREQDTKMDTVQEADEGREDGDSARRVEQVAETS